MPERKSTAVKIGQWLRVKRNIFGSRYWRPPVVVCSLANARVGAWFPLGGVSWHRGRWCRSTLGFRHVALL